jgi:hypothetical protein
MHIVACGLLHVCVGWCALLRMCYWIASYVVALLHVLILLLHLYCCFVVADYVFLLMVH